MYKQENKAEKREFFKLLGMCLAAVLISEFLGVLIAALTNKLINPVLAGNVILVAMSVGLVVLVYNHYASVYKYKITKKHIIIEKKTGRRITEYEIPVSEIKKAYIRRGRIKIKAKGKKLRLCSSMMGYKNTSIIVCGKEENVIIFEPDDNFLDKMKEYIDD